jgi:hypothetical protein
VNCNCVVDEPIDIKAVVAKVKKVQVGVIFQSMPMNKLSCFFKRVKATAECRSFVAPVGFVPQYMLRN